MDMVSKEPKPGVRIDIIDCCEVILMVPQQISTLRGFWIFKDFLLESANSSDDLITFR